MDIEFCKKNNQAPIQILKELLEYQGRTARHKCVICAYQQGINDQENRKKYSEKQFEYCTHGNKAPTSILKKIHITQGGTGRHKCATCAYTFGFNSKLKGVKKSITKLTENYLEVTEPPKLKHKKKSSRKSRLRIIDFKKSDEIKSEIGFEGEILVLNYEKNFLINSGRKDLAKKVEHISKTVGDSEGYDILSYNPDGNKKYIEVKTTTGGKTSPFFISINELEFNRKNHDHYYLYRIYNFDKIKKGKMFILEGKLEEICDIKPSVYVGIF